jgi:DNA-binding FrmR family transcriptional regulator
MLWKRMSKRLSKEEKQKIIDDWNNGIEHPDYKVVKNNIGTVVRKRRYNKKKSDGEEECEEAAVNKTEVKEPAKSKEKEKDKSWMRDIQYYNMNSTINMMSQSIRDLNERLTEYKNKQVKLKGKYKALKKAIYEDDEEESVDVETVTKPVDEVVTEPVDDVVTEHVEEVVTEHVDEPVQPQQYMKRSRRFNFGSYF